MRWLLAQGAYHTCGRERQDRRIIVVETLQKQVIEAEGCADLFERRSHHVMPPPVYHMVITVFALLFVGGNCERGLLGTQ